MIWGTSTILLRKQRTTWQIWRMFRAKLWKIVPRKNDTVDELDTQVGEKEVKQQTTADPEAQQRHRTTQSGMKETNTALGVRAYTPKPTSTARKPSILLSTAQLRTEKPLIHLTSTNATQRNPPFLPNPLPPS